MAIEYRTYKTCDLAALQDPRNEVLAERTVRFSVDGDEYEIDLSGKNAGSFFDAVRPFQKAGRRVRTNRRQRPAEDRQRTAKIRSWARENGIEVSQWGRLPADLEERYKAAHQATAT